MTGKKIDYIRPGDRMVRKDVLLEVEGLAKKGNFKDISFSLNKGEILGITGLLGSGRTELALSLFGINPADHGRIAVNGADVRINSNQDAIEHGIGYVPEDRIKLGLVMRRSVGDNITVTIIKRLLNRIGMIDRGRRKKAIEKGIADLSIKVPSPESAIMTLSGGNQQRVVLSKWIATEPNVLILDEPTVGIDVAAKSAIHDIIKRLANEGMGIIIISDEIQEVLYNCHRILVMRKGRISGEYKSGEIDEDELFRIVNS